MHRNLTARAVSLDCLSFVMGISLARQERVALLRRSGQMTSQEKSRIKSYCRPETTMRTTQQFSITLPNEMAEAVKTKVATGDYDGKRSDPRRYTGPPGARSRRRELALGASSRL